MKKNIKQIIKLILFIASVTAAVTAGIWAIILSFMNPDMTEMRLLLTYPQPFIIVAGSGVLSLISYYMM